MSPACVVQRIGKHDTISQKRPFINLLRVKSVSLTAQSLENCACGFQIEVAVTGRGLQAQDGDFNKETSVIQC